MWIKISERPDLDVFTEQDTLIDGYSICTCFSDNPGKRNIRLVTARDFGPMKHGS